MIKRRDRLVGIASYLLLNPNHLMHFKFFMSRYNCSKPTLSNDVAILQKDFQARKLGTVKTATGATGGFVYIPLIGKADAKKFVSSLVKVLNKNNRNLPGGYVYVSDLLSKPSVLRRIGKLIATRYNRIKPDVVLTMSNKSAVAPFVADYFRIPFIIANRHSKVSDGAVISVNCFTSNNHREKQLVLPRLSLKPHSKVLIVGDFLKGGSTINGMISLVKAFNCSLDGLVIFIDESVNQRKPFKVPYSSIIKFVDDDRSRTKAKLGNIFKK